MQNMRDKRLVAEHRGGSLSMDNHRKLIIWAVMCSEHILPLIEENIDIRLLHGLNVAKAWGNGNVKTGEAIKASLGAHAAARESFDLTSIAVARSVGHAVATAHMADHSLGAALYALKTVKYAGKSVDEEKKWQNKKLQKLPAEIVELVLNTMAKKEKSLHI
jgi:hypothetical protein